MKRNLQQKQKNVQKMRMRFLIVSGALCLTLILTLSFLVYLNLSMNEKIRAKGTSGGGGSIINNGEIIARFTWDGDTAVKATLGPDAKSISSSAHTSFGGRASTGGLCAGIPSKDINMTIEGTSLFEIDGIDVSIDFRRNEPSGSFITRGKSLDFGFDKKNITVSYRVAATDGGFASINEKIDYEIPFDENFRNYRFIYTPTTGKGEVFVNNVVVWSHDGGTNTAMYWKGSDDIVIGKGIDGGGIDKPVFDNLTIRSTGNVSPLAESLLSFTLMPAGNSIKVMWSAADIDKVEYFTVERSVNGLDFSNLINIKPDEENNDFGDFTYVDKNISNPGILYYRLRQIFKNGKFITHQVSAIKVNVNKSFIIEKVSPTPFKKSFNLLYYVPGKGRVWVQIINEKGKVVNSETFQAMEGKNFYVFDDKNNLEEGTYTVNLVFNESKISTSVVKAKI